jgi:ubiquinol-cytochrome c reductase cytochrome b subunit
VSATADRSGRKNWTVELRKRAVAALPPEKLLPDGQPAYMSSWIYVFGVLSLASLVVIIGSGSILALKGPTWWHVTGIGHFFNSMHLWGVELFFFFMVVHLWFKYWMTAWRGGRKRVWATGAVTFLVAIPCALTGYVSQQNFDAQWISTQAKDAMNSVGIGAFFNLMDFGQMYSYHIFLLPVAVVGIVAAHVLLVRKHGIVPPLVLDENNQILAATATDGAVAAPAARVEDERPAAAEVADAPDGRPEPATEAESPPAGEAEPTG